MDFFDSAIRKAKGKVLLEYIARSSDGRRLDAYFYSRVGEWYGISRADADKIINEMAALDRLALDTDHDGVVLRVAR